MQNNWVLSILCPMEFSLWLMRTAKLPSCLCDGIGSLSSIWVVLFWDIGCLFACMCWSVFCWRLEGEALKTSAVFSQCNSPLILCSVNSQCHLLRRSPGFTQDPLFGPQPKSSPFEVSWPGLGLDSLISSPSGITDLHWLVSISSHMLSSIKLFVDGG